MPNKIIDLRKVKKEKINKKVEDEVSRVQLEEDVDEDLEEGQASNVNERKGGVLAFFVELVKVVAISLAIVLPVRYFLIQPFYVKGASMEPSFYDHEYLIIDEITYRLGEPERGDIIVFKYPRKPDQYFIKRIVGLPGERVVVGEGKVIIYNRKNREGKVLNESDYLLSTESFRGSADVTLKNDEYFVLGDNRNSSLDSRSFGPVPEENIIGRTWLRGWPLDRVKKFDSPEYNL
ncbi:signal peptidase I [Candidatus Falkowbacteria bacterium]|nr:signal peptidase I [Candidatus Falkowbacteria bacterium]